MIALQEGIISLKNSAEERMDLGISFVMNNQPEKVEKVWKRLGRAGKSWKRLVNTGKGVRWYIFLPGINDSTGACKYERNEKAHF